MDLLPLAALALLIGKLPAALHAINGGRSMEQPAVAGGSHLWDTALNSWLAGHTREVETAPALAHV